MATHQDQIAKILYQALAEPIGLLLNCVDVQLVRTKIYQTRKVLGDPALDTIQIRAVNHREGNLVLTRLGGAPKAPLQKERALTTTLDVEEIGL